MSQVYPIKDKRKIKAIRKYLINSNRLRDWIMVSIGIFTGLRIADILNLKVKDIKNKDYLKIKQQKTKKVKKIIINNQLKEDLKEFVKGKKENEYLIRTTLKENGEYLNEHISPTQAYRIIKDIQYKLKIKESLGTHSLRKTYAYNLYKEYDISVVQKALQHENQLDTLRYIGVEEEVINKATAGLNFFD